ncbi:carboxypeptidase regulatory-like domain-containing protein [Alloacidobacterium dinghuense]|uniref:Carboxypeptidase regulatory-like domain-containing protein n=1 Tax=Alloacidobacterium dinghuense TaxID=2763107 RepID=A0A7G8BNH0_9BACT|nr:TonB-dependent receptor [Alloacidobacterium dinghuense]QNI34090.1 carboxypeptidase regulatory-like domain-containing protein [Alloacidobacterium dinghuense]
MLFSKVVRRLIPLCFGLVVLLPSNPDLLGQGITTGTVSGSVADSSGAVVEHAHITATEVSKGIRLIADTEPDGAFSLRAVPIGKYELVISASGFSNANVENVFVNAGATTDIGRIALSVTSAAEQVQVNASTSALLETSDSQVTTVFDSQQMSRLPFNNGFDTATELIPGVVSAHADNFSNTNGDTFSVNGQSSRFNNFELDGQSNNDNTIGGPQVFFGNQDAIGQLQVITNNYSAQYGRNAGAVVNYITKSGTNQFHGSGFEYYQGQFLSSFTNQAKNPLFGYCLPGQDPTTTGCMPTQLTRYVENRYGGTLGGPILKDKLWFFGSTYWNTIHTGAAPAVSNNPTDGTLTPTPAGLQQLASVFPNNPSVAILQNYGPYGVKTGNPQPVGAITMQTVTGPGGVTTTIPFSLVQRLITTPYRDQEHLGRLDWQPTGADHLFLRYFYQDLDLAAAAGDIAAGGWGDSLGGAHSIGADWTHTFNTHWVDQLRYSFQQTRAYLEGGAYPSCSASDVVDCPSDVVFTGSSDLSFGYTQNPQIPQGRIVKVTQVQNNATWSHGNHTLLLGGEIDYQNSPSAYLPSYGGTFVFNTLSNFLANGPLAGQTAQNASTLSLADGNYTTKFTELDAAGYIQDDWRVTPSFTAHIGMRWEYFSQPYNTLHNETVARESNPSTAFWDPTLPLADRTVAAVNDFYKNFQPRLGFAWNPTFDKQMVVRGGYAINSNPSFYNIFSNDAVLAPTSNTGQIVCNGANCLPSNGSFTVGGVRTANLPALPRGADPRMRDQGGVPLTFRPPYTQIYTLAIQHQLGSAAVGELRYTGSVTHKNFQSSDANPFLLPVQMDFPNYVPVTLCQDPNAVGYGRPDCSLGNNSVVNNTAWANYNGLQLNITTRNFHGLTGTFAFTQSRAIDNATDAFRSTGVGGSSIAFPQNPLNPDAPERGVSGNDFPNVVGLGFMYDFPRTQRKSGLLSRLINGYAFDSIYRYDSGQPYTFYQPVGLDAFTPDISYGDAAFNGNFNVGVGVDTSRLVLSNKKAPLNAVAYYNPYTGPTVNGSPTLGPPQFVTYQSDFIDGNGNYNPGTPMNPTTAHWIINNQAYAKLVGNPYPGSGRGINRGVTFSELDTTILKSTPITERINVELSMAAYNVLNQAYRGTPGAFVAESNNLGTVDLNNTGTVPTPTGLTSGNRFVILGAKVIF